MTDGDERQSTGIPGLDDILAGGWPRGRLYLVEGPPGVGKTTLAIQFLLAGLAAGETCLYIALSETKLELDVIARSHGWDIAKMHVQELSAAEQSAEVDGDSTLFDPSEIDLGETTRSLLAAVDRLAPQRVVLDSLSELRLLAQSPLRYRRMILRLKEYFAGRGCTVFLLDDGKPDRSDLQLQTVAHGVVGLEHVMPEYGTDRRRLRIVKLRGASYRGGYHDFAIERGGLVVFPRLVAAEHHAPFTRETISSGNAELDALVGGGFDRGTSTLFLGPAGSGKSAITSTIAEAAALRGEQPVIFEFDESSDVTFMRARSMGIPLDEYVQAGRMVVRQIDPAELSPGQFATLVRDHVERTGARVVIIDSLNGYLTAMPGEKFLVIQMHELLSYLAQRGVCTFMVVAQHGMLGTMVSPIDVTYLADAVVLTRHFEHGGKMLKALSMLKRRTGAHESSIRQLTLSSKGITVGPPLADFHGVMTGVPKFTGGTGALRNDDE